ncbi:MAG TPA: ATP-binding protein [Armatimonadota bacterium]|nr:ATP-binding protein [Armatimonadota bacterium]
MDSGETTASHPSTLRNLTRASCRIAAEADPIRALSHLLAVLRQDLGIDRAGVFAFDREERRLERVAGVDRSGRPEYDGESFSLDSGDSPLVRVATRELPYYLTDNAPRDFPNSLFSPGVRAHAVIPIIAGDELLGILCLDNCLSGRPIPEAIVEWLFLYAGLAALPLFALYQKRERERTERVRWLLLRSIFSAVTSCKVQLCTQAEIRAEWPALEAQQVLEIRTVEDIPPARQRVREAALAAGMDMDRARDFELCAAEAATNALLHGKGGFAVVACEEGRLRFRVVDCGGGISLDDLPGATLQPGWSKRRSMGLGFTLINETADRVYLYTGGDGTTLIIEMAVQPGVNLPEECNPLLWGEAFSLETAAHASELR